MKLTVKQTIALDFLEDDHTEEVLYGGAAGGGKSLLGCYWQLKQRLKFPGTRGFIGRAEYKTLKDTTLKTFMEVAEMQGLKRGLHYDLTGSWDKESPNCITFKNGSLIFLRDLFQYPSDPDFSELGSLEITDAFIDECSQVSVTAKDILKVRIRYKMKNVPKILFGTNPVKTWPYIEFYRPSRANELRQGRKFIQAFVTDNPHAPQAYVNSLRNMPEGPQKQRLFYGNWEYDDDETALILYEKILDCFTNTWIAVSGRSYITCDVARFGSDKTVIGVWNGWGVRLFNYHGLSIDATARKIKEHQEKWRISNSDTICDEDGVGGGVVDILKCRGFVNNSRPLEIPGKETENFINLKSQCYFHLAEKINAGKVLIDCHDSEIRSQIIEELEQVKQYNMDKDGKRQIIPKDKIKEIIGRSPDYADTIMMREWFDLIPQPNWVAF